MSLERTLVIIKPDAIKRNLGEKIIQVLLDVGMEQVAFIRQDKLTVEHAIELYSVHVGSSFFVDLIDYITSGPLTICVMSGENCIKQCRELVGNTNPIHAAPHTIRSIWGISTRHNSIHCSDSEDSALKEIAIFFPTLVEKKVDVTTRFVSEA